MLIQSASSEDNSNDVTVTNKIKTKWIRASINRRTFQTSAFFSFSFHEVLDGLDFFCMLHYKISQPF